MASPQFVWSLPADGSRPQKPRLHRHPGPSALHCGRLLAGKHTNTHARALSALFASTALEPLRRQLSLESWQGAAPGHVTSLRRALSRLPVALLLAQLNPPPLSPAAKVIAAHSSHYAASSQLGLGAAVPLSKALPHRLKKTKNVRTCAMLMSSHSLVGSKGAPQKRWANFLVRQLQSATANSTARCGTAPPPPPPAGHYGLSRTGVFYDFLLPQIRL